jgi:outer membrane protein OmpA-like peptidoglycan-associated protein
MKKLFAILLLTPIFCFTAHGQLLKRLGDKVKDKTEQRADQKVDKAIDKELDKAEESAKKKDSSSTSSNDETKDKEVKNATPNDTPAAAPVMKVYANYDFVPGDKILFEDHFADDQDGEFPSHWELKKGQALLNKINNEPAFFLTEGNYVEVYPRMKTEKFLTDPFTVEFDYYHVPGAYGILSMFKFLNKECDCESGSYVGIMPGEATFEGPVSLNKSYANDFAEPANFDNKWHHVAIAYKNHQLKVYVDQYRVLVVPDTKADFYSVGFGGIGSEENPIVFKNIRIASGGNMNMIGKKFTESKIITHGINFDVNKATIKPESMGTLNMIVGILKDNPDIKFEVGGHTDTDGADDYNLKLSQQRADAVRDQLIKMGVDASRLSAKGYGETKPISDNNSLEGKANNRRVEFVKK